MTNFPRPRTSRLRELEEEEPTLVEIAMIVEAMDAGDYRPATQILEGVRKHAAREKQLLEEKVAELTEFKAFAHAEMSRVNKAVSATDGESTLEAAERLARRVEYLEREVKKCDIPPEFLKDGKFSFAKAIEHAHKASREAPATTSASPELAKDLELAFNATEPETLPIVEKVVACATRGHRYDSGLKAARCVECRITRDQVRQAGDLMEREEYLTLEDAIRWVTRPPQKTLEKALTESRTRERGLEAAIFEARKALEHVSGAGGGVPFYVARAIELLRVVKP